MDRPLKVRLHVNRREMLKGRKGRPWTIHTSKACISAKSVKIEVPVSTEYTPDAPSNPRAFLVAKAVVKDLGNGHFALV